MPLQVVQFGYDNANRLTSLTLPNGIVVEYGYDTASRVTSITYKQNGTTVIGDLTYEYDKAGNRTKIGGSWARTGMPESVTTTSYDANNRQLTFGDKTLAYDDNGNLQSITDSNGTTLYQWNARNRLVGISGPSVNASFVYDGAGRRQKKTINGSITEFLFDRINPVQEMSGAAVLANVLPGLGIDEFLTRTDVVAGVTSNFLTDALGSPIAVTDNVGVVQTEYTYEPFGKPVATGASNSSLYQYTGRENDGTGLYYYRARYYHPQLQRFVSEDPIANYGGDVNFYSYVGNNSINYLDLVELAKWVFGGGYSGVVGNSGGERTAGWYWDEDTNEQGWYESGAGAGSLPECPDGRNVGGLNVGAGVYFGKQSRNLDGKNANFNFSIGPLLHPGPQMGREKQQVGRWALHCLVFPLARRGLTIIQKQPVILIAHLRPQRNVHVDIKYPIGVAHDCLSLSPFSFFSLRDYANCHAIKSKTRC